MRKYFIFFVLVLSLNLYLFTIRALAEPNSSGVVYIGYDVDNQVELDYSYLDIEVVDDELRVAFRFLDLRSNYVADTYYTKVYLLDLGENYHAYVTQHEDYILNFYYNASEELEANFVFLSDENAYTITADASHLLDDILSIMINVHPNQEQLFERYTWFNALHSSIHSMNEPQDFTINNDNLELECPFDGCGGSGSGLSWNEDQYGPRPAGINYFNKGGSTYERVMYYRDAHNKGYFMSVTKQRDGKYLVQYIEYKIVHSVPSSNLGFSSTTFEIIHNALIYANDTEAWISSYPSTTLQGIKDITMTMSVQTKNTDYFVNQLLVSKTSTVPLPSKLSLFLRGYFIDYSLNIYDVYEQFSTMFATEFIGTFLNEIWYYCGVFNCRENPNLMDYVTISHQIDAYGHSLRGIDVTTKNTHIRLHEYNDFIYHYGHLNNINLSVDKTGPRQMYFREQFTLYLEKGSQPEYIRTVTLTETRTYYR